jgi:prolyl oligopeptidase
MQRKTVSARYTLSALALATSALFLTACGQAPEQTNTEMKETASIKAVQTTAAEPAPRYFEEVEGEQALAQVNAWNDKTLGKLMADERFEEFQQEALDILNATDKIAFGSIAGNYIYNFWQDEQHVKGILRRTSLDSYMGDDTDWEILLDVDALSASENANWVYKGSTCLKPQYTRCLVSLSNGGKDAVEIREWDHNQKAFIEDGFFVPEGKNQVGWIDKDTIVLGADFGEGTLTDSGYPFVAKTVKRGQTIADAAELFRGEAADVAAGAYQMEIAEGDKEMIAYRAETFYESSYQWIKEDGSTVALPLPRKSSPVGVFKKKLMVRLQEDWNLDGTTHASGALVAFDIDQWRNDTNAVAVETVYTPNEKSTVQSVSITKSRVLVTVLENVTGKIYAFDYDDSWSSSLLNLPENGTVSVTSTSEESDFAFINQQTFTTPSSLLYVDVVNNTVEVAKSAPTRFEADNLVVEQLFATSKDGTQVPYFVIRDKDIKYDGNNPTLQYAYGGFQISMTPRYSGTLGKLWLENGGVYVLANIRGGGEFGPAWHQAGLKTKRQVIFDDMAAVSEAIIDSKLTSPRRLGIQGGSNGGLLMGVMYTQRPELYNAVISQVPLLDMLRYHTLLAGASWVGEYGSPDVPEERLFLESISPVHNVKPDTTYPNMFLVTSTKDDRVHPGHARKMAYVLEQNGYDFEYYENIDGGHSAAANLKESAKRFALETTFLTQELMD